MLVSLLNLTTLPSQECTFRFNKLSGLCYPSPVPRVCPRIRFCDKTKNLWQFLQVWLAGGLRAGGGVGGLTPQVT